VVGKNHGFVGRAQAQVHERALVLLRVIPADQHVVHGPIGRETESEPAQQPAECETLRRREAFNRAGCGEALVQREQLVKEGRSGTPVPDDEDRRCIERALPNPFPENEPLDDIQARIDERGDESEQAESDPRWRNSKAIAREQGKPRRNSHAVPNSEGEEGIAVEVGTRRRRNRTSIDSDGAYAVHA
jgi:hypothetical protein